MNGAAEVPAAPESSAKIIISYFGNEAFGDLNGDGREDAAFAHAERWRQRDVLFCGRSLTD